MDRIKFGDKERPTRFQRFINGSLWFIATSRNAIIIIIAMIIAAFLCSPDDDPTTYPFYVTGPLLFIYSFYFIFSKFKSQIFKSN